MLQIGSIVDRKYKILSEVGHGGMSVVYLAINERANKTWAIKEVRKDGVVDFEAVKQGLVVETDMLKQLNHPHLPSIVDVIDTEDSFLIVMDYIEGKSLQSVLKSNGAQPQDLVVEWGKQLCDVLSYLHNQPQPIIYRDMKPANVMLKPDGNVMLIDFGTARRFKNRAMVEDTTCLGTRGYAAPEQFGGRGETDARTDIYCLGATMYHLLSGHSPADPPYEIKPLSYWDPSFAGKGFEKIINKCCQPDPEARYQTCEELMYALEHVPDEDDDVLRSRKRKFGLFLGMAGLTALGLIGMLSFGLLKNSAQSRTYDYYVSCIKDSENLDEVKQNFMQATDIDAGNVEAYSKLIEYAQDDSEISDEEKQLIRICLNSGSPIQNKERLHQADPASYDQINFDIGYSLFFMTGHRDNSIADAEPYLEIAQNSDSLEPTNRTLSGYMYRISKFMKTRNSPGGKWRDDYSNNDLWNDLKSIATADFTESSVGGNKFIISLYSEVAFQIGSNCSNFKAAGITEHEVNEVLDTVSDGLNGIVLGGSDESLFGEELKAAKENVKQAKTLAEAVYTKRGE